MDEQTDNSQASQQEQGQTAGDKTADKTDGVAQRPDGSHVLTSGAFKTLKDSAAKKGADRALLALAKQHGYASVDELSAAIAKAKTASTQRGATQNRRVDGARSDGARGQRDRVRDPGPAPQHLGRKAAAAWDKERQKILRDNEKLSREKAHFEKKFRSERRAREDLQTEYSLREAAAAVGIRDVDYAVRLLERHATGKTEEELKGFDERKWFETLRESHPYLFGEVVRQASSSPSVTAPRGATTVQNPGGPKGGANGFDARKASRQEVNERMRKLGITPPG